MNVRINNPLKKQQLDNFDNYAKESKIFCEVIAKYYDYFILKNRSNESIGKYVSQMNEEEFKKIVEILRECPEIIEKDADLTKPKICFERELFCDKLNEEFDLFFNLFNESLEELNELDVPTDWKNLNSEKKAHFDKRIQNILDIEPEPDNFTILRLLFKFNPDAFRVLLFYTPVTPFFSFNSSLPEIFDLDKFKIQFENQISKLKKEEFKTPCQELIKYFN